MKTVPLTAVFTICLAAIAVIACGTAPRVKKPRVLQHAARAANSSAPQASSVLITQGHTVFLSNCAACHGADAGGDDGPNLRRGGLPDTVIMRAVTHGFPGEMPAFGGKLKAPEKQAVLAYVHSLQK